MNLPESIVICCALICGAAIVINYIKNENKKK